ncbi:hypothetical protein AX16_008719 [Volvariella volvacea WC 439]|nr:hypothetical protein AX16_008719 [Volvariella volvacea WC 439]
MASSGTPSPSQTSKSSRFSTLKVFKFQPKDKGTKPPPLPPKDTNNYYLNPNKSFASLVPVPDSVPSSPLPTQQVYRNPYPPSITSVTMNMNPNQSSISLVSTAPSAKSSILPPSEAPHGASASGSGGSAKKEKGLSFFKFGKRGSKASSTKSPVDDSRPPTPTDDENISMPWNFQHNIHVDEG